MDAATFRQVIHILRKRYGLMGPDHIQPTSPFRTLIGAMLSHRTRDEMTDRAYNRLFERFETPEHLARASLAEIRTLIRDVGFYRQKSKRIREVARIISKKPNKTVPSSREELMKLPGVGPKTADIVLSYAYGQPQVAVDTHVEAVSKRLGVASKEARYDEVKRNIMALAGRDDLLLINTLFVKFGREICRRPVPRCGVCPVTNYCEWYGSYVSPLRRLG